MEDVKEQQASAPAAEDTKEQQASTPAAEKPGKRRTKEAASCTQRAPEGRSIPTGRKALTRIDY
ncbi:hypothetical protein QUW15_01130 [Desulfovibrio piger]|nr:hypothetical protein [Desulfovibrio piger]